MIAGISNPPLTCQQLRVDEQVEVRALFCPGVKKLAPKAEELTFSQRHKDAESHGMTTTLHIPSKTIMLSRNFKDGVPCDPASDRRRRVPGLDDVKSATGHATVDTRPCAENMRLGRNIERNIFKIATWNVRTLYQSGKLNNAINEMKRLKIDLLGMSEIRWPGSGKCEKEDATMFYSGSRGEDANHRHGVAVLVNNKIRKHIKNFIPYSERCMLIQISSRPVDLNIIQVYAPTAESTDEEAEDFYQQLEDITKNLKKQDVTIIMGDFNAKIGRGEVGDIVGKFGLGARNERGDRLIQFCQEKNLTLTNTWFQLPPRRLYTWKAPQDRPEHLVRNQIDFIAINKRFRNAIIAAKTYPGADIKSDHVPLVAQLRVRLKIPIEKHKNKSLDRGQLRNPEIKAKLTESINNNLARTTATTGDIEKDWSNLRDAIRKSAKEEIGHFEKKKKNDWMTDEILDLFERRRESKNNPERYKEIDRTVNRKIKEAKEKWLREKCQEIEELERKHDSFNMHKKVKEFTYTYRKRQVGKLVDENNKLIVDKEEQIEMWEAYIKDLFTDYRHATNTLELDGPEILKSEVIKALEQTKDGKAAGCDEIPAEFLRLINENNLNIVLDLFNKIYDSGQIPSDWLKSTFITLPKKANSKKCSEYRLISLMSHTLKVFLRVIHSRIRTKLEQSIGNTQFGFRCGYGTREPLFAMQVLIQKCLDQQKDVYACFIDYEKAFDTVNHDKLIELLRLSGLDTKDIQIIKNLYWNQTAHIQYGDMKGRDIDIARGVRQGCVLSPLLFNLYSEQIFIEALEECDKGIKINGVPISNLRYADDTVLLADNVEDLQTMLNRVTTIGNQAGLKINRNKTKFMVISRRKIQNADLHIEMEPIERVHRFKYLGYTINDEWDPDLEIKIRIEMARSAFIKMRKLLSNRNLSIGTRWRATKCYVLSTLLYGVEGWTLKVATMQKLEAFEMWLYRRILRIPWTDRVTNAEVLRRMAKDLELITTIKKRKASYLGHIFRNDKYGLLQLIMEGKIEGRRGLGRKKKSWLKNLREWFQIPEASNIIHAAQNREVYHMMVANLR